VDRIARILYAQRGTNGVVAKFSSFYSSDLFSEEVGNFWLFSTGDSLGS